MVTSLRYNSKNQNNNFKKSKKDHFCDRNYSSKTYQLETRALKLVVRLAISTVKISVEVRIRSYGNGYLNL